MAEDLEKRIDALEARAAYQDETIETLSQAIAEQWAIIERLRRDLAQLDERVEEAAAGSGPVDRPPPHY